MVVAGHSRATTTSSEVADGTPVGRFNQRKAHCSRVYRAQTATTSSQKKKNEAMPSGRFCPTFRRRDAGVDASATSISGRCSPGQSGDSLKMVFDRHPDVAWRIVRGPALDCAASLSREGFNPPPWEDPCRGTAGVLGRRGWVLENVAARVC